MAGARLGGGWGRGRGEGEGLTFFRGGSGTSLESETGERRLAGIVLVLVTVLCCVFVCFLERRQRHNADGGDIRCLYVAE